MNPWSRTQSRRAPVAVDMQVFAHILDTSKREIAAFPQVEVGGKFIGRWSCPGVDIPNASIEAILPRLQVTLIDNLDAGAAAERTATYHLPDGPYQERLFRAVEREDPDVEHVGTWHSHHPNGFPNLSEGDRRGYRATLADPAYRPDVLVTWLATDGRGLAGGRCWLWLRGHAEPYEVDLRAVVVVQSPSPYAAALSRQRSVEAIRTRAGQAVDVVAPDGATLAAEQRFLAQRFDQVQAFRDRETGAIGWRFQLRGAYDSARGRLVLPCALAPEARLDLHARVGESEVHVGTVLPATQERRFEAVAEAVGAFVGWFGDDGRDLESVDADGPAEAATTAYATATAEVKSRIAASGVAQPVPEPSRCGTTALCCSRGAPE